MSTQSPTATPSPVRHFVLSGAKDAPALFYIQCKGAHAGRPLRHRIPNSYAVTQAPPHGFAIAHAAWVSRAQALNLRGTCIPFATLPYLEDTLNQIAERITAERLAALRLVDQLEERIAATRTLLNKLIELRNAAARTL